MATPIFVDTNAYYEGKNVREMIEDVRHWLGVDSSDTNRYPDATVVKALNYGQERFAKMTGCISFPVVVVLGASKQNYRLPWMALGIRAARYYSGTSSSDYFELKIIRDMRIMQRFDPSFRGTSGTPTYLFPSYRAGNTQMFGISPIPSSDGTTWVGSDYGVLTYATGFTNAGNITGMHKTGYSSSAFLVDSLGRNFTTLGAMVGYPVFNVTDGSSGLITAIGNADATNDKISVTLAGGTDNDWDTDDSFQIPMSEYGVVMDASGDETYTFNSALGTIYEISGGSGNLILDVTKKPLPLSATLDTFFSELPSAYHEAPIAYAVYWLGRGSYKGVAQEAKAASALEIFNAYVNEYNIKGDGIEESDKEIEDRAGREWLL